MPWLASGASIPIPSGRSLRPVGAQWKIGGNEKINNALHLQFNNNNIKSTVLYNTIQQYNQYYTVSQKKGPPTLSTVTLERINGF